ncbi:MAG: ArsR family transcriptional regulator [Rhodobacterales bacterium]|nr:MAG: ArsR family transcriptional regulator [Rhodobacterales bacterium]
MSDQRVKIDGIDAEILRLLQRDGSLSQRDVAERVGLSQNACGRRIARLTRDGVIEGARMRLSSEAIGLDLTVFMLVRTRDHSSAFAARLRRQIESIPEVAEFHRIGGEWDYLLKIVTTSMAGYDRVYRQMIERLELETVTGLFSMETIFDGRPLVVKPGG